MVCTAYSISSPPARVGGSKTNLASKSVSAHVAVTGPRTFGATPSGRNTTFAVNVSFDWRLTHYRLPTLVIWPDGCCVQSARIHSSDLRRLTRGGHLLCMSRQHEGQCSREVEEP